MPCVAVIQCDGVQRHRCGGATALCGDSIMRQHRCYAAVRRAQIGGTEHYCTGVATGFNSWQPWKKCALRTQTTRRSLIFVGETPDFFSAPACRQRRHDFRELHVRLRCTDEHGAERPNASAIELRQASPPPATAGDSAAAPLRRVFTSFAELGAALGHSPCETDNSTPRREMERAPEVKRRSQSLRAPTQRQPSNVRPKGKALGLKAPKTYNGLGARSWEDVQRLLSSGGWRLEAANNKARWTRYISPPVEGEKPLVQHLFLAITPSDKYHGPQKAATTMRKLDRERDDFLARISEGTNGSGAG